MHLNQPVVKKCIGGSSNPLQKRGWLLVVVGGRKTAASRVENRRMKIGGGRTKKDSTETELKVQEGEVIAAEERLLL